MHETMRCEGHPVKLTKVIIKKLGLIVRNKKELKRRIIYISSLLKEYDLLQSVSCITPSKTSKNFVLYIHSFEAMKN